MFVDRDTLNVQRRGEAASSVGAFSAAGRAASLPRFSFAKSWLAGWSG